MTERKGKSVSYESYLAKKLNDPRFAEMWEEEQAEMMVSIAIMEAREKEGLTQKDLAEATGMKQNAISRIERGETNPTIGTLRRIADGLGKKLVIGFE